MRNTKREDDYEKAYVKEIERDGGQCLKVQVLGRQGYPDRLVLRGFLDAERILEEQLPIVLSPEFISRIAREVVANVIHFTEMKKPGGRFQPRQPRVIKQLRDMGYRVDVVNGEVE